MWEIILGVGIIFLILEIFAPTMFFISLALSAFLCALLSVFVNDIITLIIVFAILSLILLYAIRPIFMKNKKTKEQEKEMKSKYVGKIATVLEDVSQNSGAITIYDERWQARAKEGKIKKGQKVLIKDYESLIMQVEEIKEQ